MTTEANSKTRAERFAEYLEGLYERAKRVRCTVTSCRACKV
jgi:hypothetical protein